MRLIDAYALEVFVKTVRQGIYLDKTVSDIPIRDSMLLNFQQYVHLQPTIDAVPVVRGEWKKDSDYPWLLNCSVCGYSTEHGTNYCPNCGAKMEDKP